MKKDALWVLRRARRRLKKKSRFLQDGWNFAADAGDVGVDAHSKDAAKWCLVGAVLRADRKGAEMLCHLEEHPHQQKAVEALARALPKRFLHKEETSYTDPDDLVVAYSEQKPHRKVLRLLDKAIARLEEKA